MHELKDPHHGQPVLAAGEPLEQARAAAILVHGRGAGAEDILSLAYELDAPVYAWLAPQAAGYTWYPQRFLAPLSANQPFLDSALALLARTLAQVQAAGIPSQRTLWLGFSQGACLALEFAARNAQRYGGVVGLSGGLVGPAIDMARYRGDLAGTPVFLGCSDIDPHIPKERVLESAQALETLGGSVTARLYPGLAHTVNQDELDFVQALVDRIPGGN